MRDGPELIFGDATRARAKWIAATRVLADPEAEGASYIDVRLPGRPAAGGLPAATLAPVAPAGTAGHDPRRGAHRHDRRGPGHRAARAGDAERRPGDRRAERPPRARRPPHRPLRRAPSRRPPPPIPPAPEAPRRPPAEPQPIVELYTNSRAKLEPLLAGFLARAIDTSAELHLESGFCGRRKPSTLA